MKNHSEEKLKKHLIKDICNESIADELGIKPGSFLLSVNNFTVHDVFDYRTMIFSEEVNLDIQDENGDITCYEIEKDEQEDIGLIFENELMDREKACANKCIFCFVDQLPEKMRKTLYFKDDDIRLSFLTGNYVTLTNTSDKELERLISYRLSPVNVSVHTTDSFLRQKMTGNKKAGKIMSQLKKITDAGIRINCQIVLCPGINDGFELEKTIKDLKSLGENVVSIAVVPAGITGFRGKKGLYPLIPLGVSGARRIIESVTNWQQIFYSERKKRVVFAADEIYIRANAPLPESDKYDDFPQIENGVGMTSSFVLGMKEETKSRIKLKSENKSVVYKNRVMLVTGVDAKAYLEDFKKDLEEIYGMKFIVTGIKNTFFGENITVAGLVTASDIIRELAQDKAVNEYEKIIIPRCMLRAGENTFLDDITLDQLEKRLGREIICVSPDAKGLFTALDKLK